uniref:Hydroxyproline-rich glycoprotein family protein n=1 Tax=Noccaea caerulescens TaxID=107243 RepID=A0A1J3HD63_NOCCA
MMRNVNNSVETVNAAATAIVNAESRVQPSSLQKRRWAKCWSLSCFGAQKNNKRIVNAVLVPEPVAASGGAPVVTVQNSATSTSVILPFIAPPSSPASFLQSDPSSVSHSPVGLTGNTFSLKEPQSVFAVGPYANETQPVTPPVFSAFITEPSTAPYTPPPESSVHIATPSSPEVPFAQLLTSSLELTRRDSSSGMNQKFSKSHYEFRSNQVCPGSPGGGNLISPGSVISNSGTSSPYPGKSPMVEFRVGEPPKFLGFEHFTARKWGSRFGSGSITPVGHGSGVGSGALTPNGPGMVSGNLTPNSTAWPQISEVASLASSDHGSEVVVADHRVSFELTGEDVARCLASKLNRSHDRMNNNDRIETEDCSSRNRVVEKVSGDIRETEQQRIHKLSSSSIGSSKEFKFDNTKEENVEKVAGNSWSFFPGLRSGVS